MSFSRFSHLLVERFHLKIDGDDYTMPEFDPPVQQEEIYLHLYGTRIICARKKTNLLRAVDLATAFGNLSQVLLHSR